MKYFMISTIFFILAQAHASDFTSRGNPLKAEPPIEFQQRLIPKISKENIQSTDKRERTMGHYAAQAGYDLLLEAIIEKAKSHGFLKQLMDKQDSDGDTMLHKAVLSGQMEVVELLLTYGAETSVENKFNLTPSLLAKNLNLTDIEQRIKTKELVGEIMKGMERIELTD